MGSIGLTELPGPALHGRTAENVVQKLVRHLEEDIVLGYLNPRERLAELGVEPATDTPAEFGAHIASETKQWSDVARSAHITPN